MKIEDMEGNEIGGYNFGDIQRGDITNPVPIVIHNDSGNDRYGILIKADHSLINHRGLVIDTIASTFISLDGKDGFLEQIIDIPANSKRVVYLHFQPTYLAIPGGYRWCLLVQETVF